MALKLICEYNKLVNKTITRVVQNNGNLLVIKLDSGEVAIIDEDLSLITSGDIMDFEDEQIEFIHHFGFINDMELNYVNTVRELEDCGFSTDDLKRIYNVLKIKFEG